VCEKSAETKTIGSWHLGTLTFFSGWLQYVGLYEPALTPAQVAALFQAGHRGIIRPTPIDTQLKAVTG
jgi:hypothetical protein